MDEKEIRQNIESILEENKRLKVLLHLAQNLQTHLELDKLLLTSMEEVARIINADRCSIFLLDEKKQELWSIVALGIEKGKQIRFPSDKGIAGYVCTTGEVLNIEDTYRDSRFNPEIDKKTGYLTKNILTMPLINNNQQIIGVVQLLNKSEGSFTKADEELLDAISKIVATTVENSLLYEEQVESLNSFVETLSATLDTRDYITAGHSRRVTLYTLELCRIIEMDVQCSEQLRFAGLLHDIGKLGIPESVLFKTSKLSEEEYKIVQNHPAVTRQILSSIHFPRNLEKVPEIASTHHEKINGMGYPEGLKGDEIPLGGRLLALADVFDALTSKRQYRDREPIEKIWSIIEEESGISFDPLLVDVFQEIELRKILEIMEYDFSKENKPDDLFKLEKIPFRKLLEIKRKSEKDLTPEEKKTLEVFDKYYWRKYQEES